MTNGVGNHERRASRRYGDAAPGPERWRDPLQLGRHDAMHASLGQLTWQELLLLGMKLRRAKRQAFRAALRSGSLPQAWDMIRIINDLADLAHDVDQQLARALPPWLPP
jgi:hypothetical protein